MCEQHPKTPRWRAPNRLAAAVIAAVMSIGAVGCQSDQAFSKSDTNLARPDISVSPQQLEFYGVAFGSDDSRTFTITNNGTAALNVASIRLEQSQAFTLLAEVPVSVPVGGSVDVEVVYSPVTDADDGRVFIDSDDPDTPVAEVELLGTSGSPRLVIDPPSHDFGILPLYCADAVVHTLRNEGTADLLVTDLYQIGEGYGLDNANVLPLTLAPGEEAEVTTTFEALLDRQMEGALYVESNDPGGLRQATHTGIGDASGVCIAVPPGDEEAVELDFTAEYKLVDVAFVLDTTGSMSGFATQVARSFAAIAGEVAARIPDVTFGAATYEDYVGSFGGTETGSPGDLPWRLRQQQTSDLGIVEGVLNGVRVNSGADAPESTHEALFQAATGRGWDQNCNGAVDASTDVPPFIAGPGDAFGGTAADVYDASVEGTGEVGGMGFREGVLPIIIYGTDAPLRDPDRGDSAPGDGTCNPGPAGSRDAISALNDIGAKTIGIMVGGGGTNRSQMENIAEGTNSYGDFDGDGRDELAVLSWSTGDLTTSVADAIEGIVEAVVFDEVTLRVEGDDGGFVAAINPERYTDVPSGDEMPFEIEFEGAVPAEPNDRTYPIDFVLEGRVGDIELVLDRFTIYVLVPGA